MPGGTQILTDQGPVAVEHLQIGDRVWTLDNGYRPVLWMDQTTLSADDLEAHPHLRPVLLPRSVFRGDADLLVSRRHLILSAQDRLHRAQDLLERPDLNARLVSDGRDVTYFHLLLDRHQIVSANGVLSESFYPSTRALQSLSSPARDRLSQILPWTCAPSWYDPAAPLANYGPTARPEAQPTDPFTPVTRTADSSAA